MRYVLTVIWVDIFVLFLLCFHGLCVGVERGWGELEHELFLDLAVSGNVPAA